MIYGVIIVTENIQKNKFESLIKSSKPVLADFYATWCAPCRMLAPTIEEIHNEYNDYFETVKVNVDENPELAEYYGVSGIPALLLFKDGKEILRMSGVQTKERIISAISERTGESFV